MGWGMGGDRREKASAAFWDWPRVVAGTGRQMRRRALGEKRARATSDAPGFPLARRPWAKGSSCARGKAGRRFGQGSAVQRQRAVVGARTVCGAVVEVELQCDVGPDGSRDGEPERAREMAERERGERSRT
jgi:hypothetical protein